MKRTFNELMFTMIEDDRPLQLARYIVIGAFREALRDSSKPLATTVMLMAHSITVELLMERGLSQAKAKELADIATRFAMEK